MRKLTRAHVHFSEEGTLLMAASRKNDKLNKRKHTAFIKDDQHWSIKSLLRVSFNYLGVKKDTDLIFSRKHNREQMLEADSLRANMRQILREAGCDKLFTSMKLRSHATSKLSLSGTKIEEIQVSRGWSKEETLSYYNKRDNSEKAKLNKILWDIQ